MRIPACQLSTYRSETLTPTLTLVSMPLLANSDWHRILYSKALTHTKAARALFGDSVTEPVLEKFLGEDPTAPFFFSSRR